MHTSEIVMKNKQLFFGWHDKNSDKNKKSIYGEKGGKISSRAFLVPLHNYNIHLAMQSVHSIITDLCVKWCTSDWVRFYWGENSTLEMAHKISDLDIWITLRLFIS